MKALQGFIFGAHGEKIHGSQLIGWQA